MPALNVDLKIVTPTLKFEEFVKLNDEDINYNSWI